MPCQQLQCARNAFGEQLHKELDAEKYELMLAVHFAEIINYLIYSAMIGLEEVFVPRNNINRTHLYTLTQHTWMWIYISAFSYKAAGLFLPKEERETLKG